MTKNVGRHYVPNVLKSIHFQRSVPQSPSLPDPMALQGYSSVEELETVFETPFLGCVLQPCIMELQSGGDLISALTAKQSIDCITRQLLEQVTYLTN